MLEAYRGTIDGDDAETLEVACEKIMPNNKDLKAREPWQHWPGVRRRNRLAAMML
jgi:hypothetical protein